MAPFTVIKLQNLKKTYSGRPVLDGVDLEIKQGEIFGIVGRSGSGKTTLLNSIIAFVKPDEGSIQFRMQNLLRFSDTQAQFESVYDNLMSLKSIVGVTSQAPSFYPNLTVQENLEYFADLHSLSKEAKKTNVTTLLRFLGLADSRKVFSKNLSGGMQKRLDVGCALVHDPKILIMDEPSADLDPISRQQMVSLIEAINEKGTTIIIASHFLDEMEFLCDRIGLLYNGKIIQVGTPEELKQKYSKQTEIQLRTRTGAYEEIKKSLEKKSYVKSIIAKDKRVTIMTTDVESAISEILKIIKQHDESIIDLSIKEPTLQEAFKYLLTGGNK